jgi:hypothetical protein
MVMGMMMLTLLDVRTGFRLHGKNWLKVAEVIGSQRPDAVEALGDAAKDVLPLTQDLTLDAAVHAIRSHVSHSMMAKNDCRR